MKEFPLTKLLTMATIDTIHFAGLIVSAAGVQPVLTVLLLHASTPFMAWGSMYAFPQRKFSDLQTTGARLIALAVLLSMVGSFLNNFYPGNHQLSDPYSTLIYVAMCALHGISTLYKVHLSMKNLEIRCNPLPVPTERYHILLIRYLTFPALLLIAVSISSLGEGDYRVVQTGRYPLLEQPLVSLSIRNSTGISSYYISFTR
jgi:hypothetical protein